MAGFEPAASCSQSSPDPSGHLSHRGMAELREQISVHPTFQVIGLVGG